ncbi:MAG: phospho-N-acetylmuramoyl-pentapeptide-transferase, partial [Rhodospirillales bacterium]|nr:phospho-N-acetylmuramoyl-pentapeptide-transferase [Rhodospirillales bacterium]
MLFLALYPLADELSALNVFRYLTFRSGGAVVTSLLVSFIWGPALIRMLKSRQNGGQPIRDDGPESHLLTKRGTPTMGGFLILLAMTISTLLWADLRNGFVWAVLIVTISFGAIGFLDDYRKVTYRNSKGLPGRTKLILQLMIAASAAFWITTLSADALQYRLALPFFKDLLVNLGPAFIALAAFVIVGASNAVNLTDGLDGLAIVPVLIAAGVFALIAYLVGNTVFSNYLQIHYVRGAGELAVFCGAMVGAGLGFLWFNAPPARVFMGDTGSLSLGGALGAVAVVTRHELVLALVGGLFVLETVSVIVQVISFKLTGRRVFRMAPL